MHIAYFQAGYPVPDGTTTAVHGLSLGLARQGIRVTIYGCGPQRELDRLSRHPDLQVHLFRGLSLRGFSMPRALISRLERNEDRVGLLVINTMFNAPNLAVARAARKGGIPYVMSPHDPYHPELLAKNWFRKKIYAALFERPLLRRAAAVQVLSADHTRYLDQFGVRRALVIPNGFDAADDSELPEYEFSRTGQLPGNPRFVCLGRLDAHHKGLDLLIRGFASALRAGSLPGTAMISFVGPDGGDLEALQRLASARDVGDRVSFTGRVPDQARRAILHECDVLLLCSRYDGFGLAALEGMLAAKPVVVSRQAGISTWVEKARAGIVAEPSATGIHNALTECMSRKDEWATLGQNGRSFAYQYLTWDRVANHAARCYAKLVYLLQDLASADEPMQIIGPHETDDSELEPMVFKCL